MESEHNTIEVWKRKERYRQGGQTKSYSAEHGENEGTEI